MDHMLVHFAPISRLNILTGNFFKMYPKSAAPRYVPGGSANAVICLVVALVALILRFVHIHENKKLERAELELQDDDNVQQGPEGRSAGFRYVV